MNGWALLERMWAFGFPRIHEAKQWNIPLIVAYDGTELLYFWFYTIFLG